ncbi:MAG TPA: Hsp20/alpha crystallin family protein [Thermodesulfobacteriota bacterium]|nr:Hsp20/alpha crystallin family protein [Thermodesulfobacteriota bacterium]
MAAILRFDPFRDLQALQARMNRLFEAVVDTALAALPAADGAPAAAFTPAVDLWETPEHYLMRVEIPGVAPEDVKVEVSDNTLVIRGERRLSDTLKAHDWLRQEGTYGAFYRAMTLPAAVDPDKVQARVQNGVLEVILPKTEEAKAKLIPIAA